MSSNKITGFIFIRLKQQNLENFLAKLKELPQIKHYSVVTGEFDGVLEVEVSEMSKLFDLFKQIDKFEGIEATNTHIVMKKFDFN